MTGLVLQALAFAAVTSLPFLGVRATADPDDGRYRRTGTTRAWVRVARWFGPARASVPPAPPALAPSSDGRGACSPTTAPAGPQSQHVDG